MVDPVRVAVVGSGYFGRFHADHYSRNPRAKLVAVVDTDVERARAVAKEFGAEPASDYRSIVGRVDAASVAVPTPLHYDVARDLIEAGIHVLVEKPLTDSVESGRKLADLAAARKRVLQVGHIERFSSAYRTLAKIIANPLYFESYRIAPATGALLNLAACNETLGNTATAWAQFRTAAAAARHGQPSGAETATRAEPPAGENGFDIAPTR